MRLAEIIKNYLLSQISELASDPDADQRITFSGPTTDILKQIHEAFLRDGSTSSVVLQDVEAKFPVFLLNSKMKSPEIVQSCTCPADYLVSIRNSTQYRRFIALVPNNESLNLSLESAVTPLGYIPKRRDTYSSWVNNNLISYILDFLSEAISISGDLEPADCRNIIEFSLEKLWEYNASNSEKKEIWSLLQKLSTLQSLATDAHLLCALGFINGTHKDNLEQSIKLLEKISDLFVDTGIKGAEEYIVENLEPELEQHVRQFCEHIRSKCKWPKDFSNNPTVHYSPLKITTEADTIIPEWWTALTIDEWEKVFSNTSSGERDTLVVSCTDTIVTSKGTPTTTYRNPKFLFKFKNSDEATLVEDKTVSIFRSVGSKPREFIEDIQISSDVDAWEDQEPPEHERILRYEFQAANVQPAKLSLISLDSFKPAIALHSHNAEKITPFKWNAKGKVPLTNQARPQYECDVHFMSTGIHNLQIHTKSGITVGEIAVGYETDTDGGGTQSQIIKEKERLHSVRIKTDDECRYEFSVEGDDGEKSYVINVTAGEAEPKGVRSEFEKLICLNSDQNTKHLQILSGNGLINQYFEWTLDEENSFFPVIFGPDVKNSWRVPEWGKFDTLSLYQTQLDPRPKQEVYHPPEPLIEARNWIRDALINYFEDKERSVVRIEFSTIAKTNADFLSQLERYLDLYQRWLEDDFESAIWFDTITFHEKSDSADVLLNEPTAVLLTPLHPLKLAWQTNAQCILASAIDDNLPCPAASQINGNHFPNCLQLPLISLISNYARQGYFSVGNSSDYWSVLWNAQKVNSLNRAENISVFKEDLGISLQGLTSGFTASQMVKSLDEMLLQNPAKSQFELHIHSGTNSLSDCNEGILEWASDNLGPEVDEWKIAAPTQVEVVDFRAEEQIPEASVLADLTKKCDAAISWYSQHDHSKGDKADLAVLAHVTATNTNFQLRDDHTFNSSIDKSLTFRNDLKSPIITEQSYALTETLIGNFPKTKSQSNLQKLLSNCLATVESSCAELFDSMIFSPDTALLESILNMTQYCAVSSLSLDQTCFANLKDKSYLWDFELPNYSQNVTDNSGYFLIANENENMMIATRQALQTLKPDLDVSDELVSEILQEISLRGIPTLKNMTAGGTTAFGEVGLLSAVKHLQLSVHDHSSGLIPIETESAVNLVIPSDIFHKRYDRLRNSLKKNYSERRPDLIVLSTLFDEYDSPIALKITPIEIKTRNGSYNESETTAHLRQAQEFAQFLKGLSDVALRSEMWGVAWRDLIISWLEYGFKTTAQTLKDQDLSDWLRKQNSIIQNFMRDELTVEIDVNGRLITISDVRSSTFRNNVIHLSKSDAAKVFEKSEIPHIENLRERACNAWDTLPTQPNDGDTKIVPDNVNGDTSDNPSQTMDINDDKVVDQNDLDTVPEPNPTSVSDGIKFIVGETIDTVTPVNVELHPSNTRLNNINMGIVGDLGTGKTQLIKALVYNLVKNPEQNRGTQPNLLILDYKKDYSNDDFVRKTGAKVYAPKNLPLNPFNTKGSNDNWLDRTKFFTDLLDKIYSGIGPLQKENIKSAIKKSFKENVSDKDPTISEIFETYKEINPKVDTPWSIMSDLVDGEHFEEDPQKIITFGEFLDGVVVIDLSQLGQDDRTKNVIVALFLNLFYEYMIKTEKKEFIGTNPSLRFIDSFLLVDEADNIMKYDFPVLRKLLLEGREFGVGIILASQYLSHFKASGSSRKMDYREPLLTWFIHKVPRISENDLIELGISSDGLASRIGQLELHQCLCKTLDCDGELIRGTPFYKLE